MRKFLPILLVLSLVGYAGAAQWDGGAADGNWGSATNWDTDLVPTAADDAVIDSNSTLGVVDPAVSMDVAGEAASLSMDAFDVGSTASLTISGQSLDIGGDINIGRNSEGTLNFTIDNGSLSFISDDLAHLNFGGPNSVVNFDIINGSYIEGERLYGRQGHKNFNLIDSEIQLFPTDDDDNYLSTGAASTVTANIINSTFIQNGDPDHYDTLLYEWDSGEGETDPELRPGLDADINYNLNVINSNVWWRGRWYSGDALNDVNWVIINSDIYANKFLIRSVQGSATLNFQDSRIITSSYHRYAEISAPGTFNAVATNCIFRGSDVSWRELSNAGKFNLENTHLFAGGDDSEDLQEMIDVGKYVSFDGNGVFVGPKFFENYVVRGATGGFTCLSAVPDVNYPAHFWPHDGMPEEWFIPANIYWTPGANPASQNVYIGTDEAEVLAGTSDVVALGPDANEIEYQTIPNTVYYWRVEEVNGVDTWTSPVNEFRSNSGKARNPIPENGDDVAFATGGSKVEWIEGGGWVDSQVLYFGTDETAVANATSSDPEWEADLAGDTNEYTFGPLELETTFYWRVDSVDDGSNVPGGYEATGDVWSFTTDNYYLVEDFESYTSSSNLENTWQGYSFDPSNNGAEVFLDIEPAFVRSGAQSMDIAFDQSANYSTVERTYASGQDWTASNVAGLVLYFYGASFNDVETQYVRLTDASSNSYDAAYPGSADDILVEDWTEWNAELQDFADNGVSLTAVKKVAITYSDNVGNAYGLVTYDDIRLYRVRCVPSLSALVSDFTGDCIVDSDDLEEMSGDWLKEGLGLVTATTPDSGALELQWTFDSDVTTGSTIADSTANGNNGLFVTDPNLTPIVIGDRIEADGVPSNSFHFKNGGNDLVNSYSGITIPAAIFDNMTDEATVTLWVKNTDPAQDSDGGVRMWDMRYHDTPGSDDDGDKILAVEANGDNSEYDFGDDDESVSYDAGDWYTEQLDWVNYIFARDADNLTIYKNGILVAQTESSGNAFVVPNVLFLGCDARSQPNAGIADLNDGFLGNIDDFRVYSYSFSVSDALGFAGLADYYYDVAADPINSPADVYDDNKIDLKDYSVLAEEWLDEDFWP